MTQPQQEYIITEEQIQRLFKDKDAVTFATENVCYEVRSRPHTSTPLKTWESCYEKFTCPNGEDCWYLSEDYHKDNDTATRYATLDKLYDKANQRQMDVETEDGTIIEVIEKGEVLGWIGSLRSEP